MSSTNRVPKSIRTEITSDKNNTDFKKCATLSLTDTTRPTESSECGSEASIFGSKKIQLKKSLGSCEKSEISPFSLQYSQGIALSEKKKNQNNNKAILKEQDQFLKRFSIRHDPTNNLNVSHVTIPILSPESTIKSDKSKVKRARFTNSFSRQHSIELTLDEEKQIDITSLSGQQPPVAAAAPISKKKINDLIQKERSNAISSARSSLRRLETLKNMQENQKTRLSIRSNGSGDEIPQEQHFSYYTNYLIIKFNYFVISPDETCMFVWLIILTVCTLYNLWFIIARQSFELLQINYAGYFRVADAIADFVYLLDILVQFRTGYLEQGLLVYDTKKLAKNYVKSQSFLLDIFSILPLELLELYLGYKAPMLRFPRYFKLYRSHHMCLITESRTLYPNVWRVSILTHILLLLGHWFAGFYFLISKAEGFKGHWSYPEPVEEFALLSRMYLRCLYWSTLTLTTIGDLPPPETNWQYCFSIFVHYLAVFVIALIVGQVGNVITNRNANRLEFERLLDGAKQYMRNHNVPQSMQTRVQRWYDYSWSRGRMNGAGDLHSIGLLPDKLKTELALHVNLETLRKVTIFHECQPEFLHDLVLKMRADIFTPGDMICRKGEVAREMFIIADGVLEVIGDNGQVFTKMYSGDFFGEIGILNLEGSTNKRTADVRSVGYAELFSLSKEDVLSAVRDYPDAEKILMEYGKRRLNQNTTNQKIYQSDKKEVVSDLESLTASIDSSFQKSVPNVPMQTDIFGMPGRLKTDNNSLFMHSHYKNGKKSTQGSYVKMQLEEAIKNLEDPSDKNIQQLRRLLNDLNDNICNDLDLEKLDEKLVLKTILC